MSLEELSSNICQKMETLKSSDKSELEMLIMHLFEALSFVRTRFIDIDPSLKDDEEELRRSAFDHLHAVYETDKADELYGMYEILKSYLFMRVRHGEAADWFLKNELG